jgi:sec-independent protein translocase protein TatB
VFGLSFGEIVILGIIALVVVGPRRLPAMLRTAGQVIGKVRRMAMEIRTESGIDEILDAEGIRSEIDNFRRLATGEIVLDEPARKILPERDREYPLVGPDAYGALSEDIVPYAPSPAAPPPGLEPAPVPSETVARGTTTAEPAPSADPPRGAEDSDPELASGGLASTGADAKS